MVERIESRGENKPDDGDEDDAPGHVTLRIPWEKQSELKGLLGLEDEKETARNSSLAECIDNRLAGRESRPGLLVRAQQIDPSKRQVSRPFRLSRFLLEKDQGLGAT